ncbi:MAG: hypothetical protein ACQKBY_03805 [Verrucomicrobiales bacterium]
MNASILLTLSAVFLSLFLSGCKSRETYVTTIVRTAAEGLDLQAVTDLATRVSSAEAFEKELNKPGNTINNLDLNEDDKTDYIKITEINEGEQKGFSLTTHVGGEKDQEQELAVIQFEKNKDGQGTIQTTGNEQIYGHNHYYHHRTSFGDVLLWSYLLSSHRPYHSPYGYRGAYPSAYQASSTRSHSNYQGLHQNKPYKQSIQKTSAPVVSKPIKSPNFNKSASKIKAPLSQPTTSQRSFQKANPSKSLPRRSAFGSSSSRFGSSSSRSRSSFGGGK